MTSPTRGGGRGAPSTLRAEILSMRAFAHPTKHPPHRSVNSDAINETMASMMVTAP